MTRAQQRGLSASKGLALLLAAAIAALGGWYVYAEQRRSYWDDRVRELCAKDGGLEVIERVRLPSDEFKSLLDGFGNLSFRVESAAKANAPFFLRPSKTRLRESDPEVVRYEEHLVRRADDKVIARLTTYSRIGGDPGLVDNPSSFSCENRHGNWFSQSIQQVEQ